MILNLVERHQRFTPLVTFEHRAADELDLAAANVHLTALNRNVVAVAGQRNIAFDHFTVAQQQHARLGTERRVVGAHAIRDQARHEQSAQSDDAEKHGIERSASKCVWHGPPSGTVRGRSVGTRHFELRPSHSPPTLFPRDTGACARQDMGGKRYSARRRGSRAAARRNAQASCFGPFPAGPVRSA